MKEVWPSIRRRLAAILQTIIVAPIYFAVRLFTLFRTRGRPWRAPAVDLLLRTPSLAG